jgi:hypothetical protein
VNTTNMIVDHFDCNFFPGNFAIGDLPKTALIRGRKIKVAKGESRLLKVNQGFFEHFYFEENQGCSRQLNHNYAFRIVEGMGETC